MRSPCILAVLGAMLPAFAAMASSSLSVDSVQVVPGSTAQVAVRFTTDTNATGVQFDLLFATNYLQLGNLTRGDALSDHFLGTNLLAPGQFRVLAISFSNSPLTNGVVVYMPFGIAGNSPDHDESLVLSNFLAVNAAAQVVPLTPSNGLISIVVPPQFTAISPTNGGMHLELTGTTGRVCAIQATTNLVPPQWTSLITNTNISGVLLFDDFSAGSLPARYYRARVER